MPVFQRRIDAKIAAAVKTPRIEKVVTKEAEARVERAKDKLMRDIDNDPTSIKIESDPETIGLFGFRPDDSPIDGLKFVIENRIGVNTRPRKTGRGRRAEYKYYVKYPSDRDVYSESVLNLPWISKPWVQLLQEGITNIEKFFFYPPKGRSDFGFQSKGNTTRPVSDPRDPDYLDRIRKYFADNLKEEF